RPPGRPKRTRPARRRPRPCPAGGDSDPTEEKAMHIRWWAIGCLVACQTVAMAQPPRTPPTSPVQLGAPQTAGQPPPQPTPHAAAVLDPQNNPLDRFLVQWENEMKAVESLVAPNMSRTEVNMTYEKTDVYVGSAKYLKPNFAMLELQKKSNPEYFEKFISNGQY